MKTICCDIYNLLIFNESCSIRGTLFHYNVLNISTLLLNIYTCSKNVVKGIGNLLATSAFTSAPGTS